VTLLGRLYGNRWVRYALTLTLASLVVVKVQPQHLVRALGSARPQYVAIALVLTFPFLYLKAMRWHAMLRAAGIEVDFWNAAQSLIAGMGLALVTPARLGELVRVAYVDDPRRMKIGGLVMIDKGFDVLVLSGLSVAGAGALIGAWAAAALAVATLLGLAGVYWPHPITSFLGQMSARSRHETRLVRLWSSLDSLRPASTSYFLALTLLAFGVVLLQFGFILLSWKSWSLGVVFLTFPLVVLTNVLPITIGGLGLREGAAALLLGHFGVSAADAALAAFLMFALNTALPGLVGALLPPPATSRPELRTPHSLDMP
jgi:glycosyltransferase 2 family protein